MKSSASIALYAFLIHAVAFDASAWNELGPLEQVRREHPEYFGKGAVHEVEVDGESYWLFTGDGIRERKLLGTDSEAYREAALDARRNLLRHLTGNVQGAKAEVSGIVTAYRLSDGLIRRVVCLVPKENVSVVSPAPATPPAVQQGGTTNAAVSKATETVAPNQTPAAVPDAAEAQSPTGPSRFQMPDLPTPVLPGDR
jgi:hypothetical protein